VEEERNLKERGDARLCPAADVGAVFQQELSHSRVSLPARHEEGRLSVVVRHLHVCSVFQQQLRDLEWRDLSISPARIDLHTLGVNNFVAKNLELIE
jgi:hypothetical protein